MVRNKGFGVTATRPSTHPAEQYRRELTDLEVALRRQLQLLLALDPLDRYLEATTLAELLGSWADEFDVVADAAELLQVRPMQDTLPL